MFFVQRTFETARLLPLKPANSPDLKVRTGTLVNAMSELTPLLFSPCARRVQLLGNGQYSVVLTDAGTGYSQWRGMAITRWREDPTCDQWGSFILLRDMDNGISWSPTRQPMGVQPEVIGSDVPDKDFSAGSAKFTCDQAGLTTTLRVAVASGCDGELRRVTLHNTGEVARDIQLTSYAELVLGPAAADATHSAFAKMFVQTHWDADHQALLATRRKRSPDDTDIWAAHFIGGNTQPSDAAPEYETDRARLLGRCNPLLRAAALQPGVALSNTVGTVLDSIFSLRTRVRIEAGATVHVDFWTLAAPSRHDVLNATRDLCSADSGTRTLADNVAPEAEIAAISDSLLAPLLYADPAWRAEPERLLRGAGGAPVLWSHGISGDRPILLLHVADPSGCSAAQTLLRAQSCWRRNWLGIDIVLLNAASGDDAALVKAQLEDLKKAHSDIASATNDGAKAEVFVLSEEALDRDFRDGLATAARVVLMADGASWKPIRETIRDKADTAAEQQTSLPTPSAPQASEASQRDARSWSWPGSDKSCVVEFDNGIGGFIGDGREYRIVLEDGTCAPAPWINVVANPDCGFIASAEGGGYTWSGNSQQSPLTPWPNDPVTDAPSEILYLRDQESGELWTAAATPIRVPGSRYEVVHGKGWTRCSHRAHEIDVDLLQFVPVADSIKLSRLRLRNASGRTRKLSVTGYVHWALGPNGANTAPFVTTSLDPATGALFACNHWRQEFLQRIAFIDFGGAQTSFTGDRGKFLGCYGCIEAPAALSDGQALSGDVGIGLDPCGALQTQVTLEPGQQVELVFALGDAASTEQAQALVRRYRKADLDGVLSEAKTLWDDILDTVQVRTPDRALDILLNDWLPYQTLGCRVWGRSAYYQSSGAYGFRDQLQDVMALCVSRPDIAREHIVRSAGRQFPEGDVQHWWLPPSGQGIRTTMSDDRLWLPYVAAHYILTTSDAAVLDECIPFLQGETLKDGQHEAFFTPGTSDETASVYEHGARAIDVSLELGAHGLPLIGTGDWNDGMNRVGIQGKGESVWLAWFLIATIEAYAEFAESRDEAARASRWRQHAKQLRKTVEDTGWDGDWYRRGYYDDGTPLGSARSLECQIDTIAQSWSAIAAASNQSHVASAMDAVHERLLHPDDGVALLFTPPFDDGPTDPGYIKGYPPGLRENGGQYTHGAIWSVFAFAKLGQGDRAGACFNILNPVHHADSPEKIRRYKVEPYVACADVYSVAPLIGRGGWTWYTGSAGWLYRAGLEAILGFQLRGDTLVLDPCIPAAWPGFSIVYCHRGTRHEIEVKNPRHVQQGVAASTLDGDAISGDPRQIDLHDDGNTHHWTLTMGDVP